MFPTTRSVLTSMSDISNPRHAEQDASVEKILDDLGVNDRPRLRVFNKVDLLDSQTLTSLAADNGNIYVSARTGAGLDALLQRVDQELPIDPLVHLEFSVPLTDGRTLALVHGLGRVLRSQVCGTEMQIEADLPQSVVRRLRLTASTALDGEIRRK